MLTINDFKEKKLLSVNTDFEHQYCLRLINDNLRLYKDNEIANQISIHLLLTVFIIGDLSITSSLIKKLNSNGISIYFLNKNLETKAYVPAIAQGNYLLREKQYVNSNETEIAKKIVLQKINNQEIVLIKNKVKYDKKVFVRARSQLKSVTDVKFLLGIEGNVGKCYFQSLFNELGWYRRSPQTKEDITNLLLDIGYTYLFNYCDSLLSLFGFDTYKGNYHKLFFQRKSLSCDVMEPMRPLIDAQIVKSYHLKQINVKDFSFKNGSFEFNEGFKTSKKYSAIFLELINTHKEEIYEFILGFYHYYMNNEKYNFPIFKID